MDQNVNNVHYQENGTTTQTLVTVQHRWQSGTTQLTTANAPKDSTDQNVRPVQIQENGTSPQINAFAQLQRLSGTGINAFVIKICSEINVFLVQLQGLGTPQRISVFAHLQRLFSQAVIANAQLAFTETTAFHVQHQDTGTSTQNNAFVKILWSGMGPTAAALNPTSCTKETASNVPMDTIGSITDAKNAIVRLLIFKSSAKTTPELQAQQAAVFSTDANKTSNLPKTAKVVTFAFALHPSHLTVLHKHANENEIYDFLIDRVFFKTFLFFKVIVYFDLYFFKYTIFFNWICKFVCEIADLQFRKCHSSTTYV